MNITNKKYKEKFREIAESTQGREYCQQAGDLGEDIVEEILQISEIPYIRTPKKHPLDFIVGEYGVEVKLCAFSLDGRIILNHKKGQIRKKNKYCRDHGLGRVLLVVYVDTEEEELSLLYRDRFKGYMIRSLWSAFEILSIWLSRDRIYQISDQIRSLEPEDPEEPEGPLWDRISDRMEEKK